jgi:dTDP-4-dehydrorhamnose 3,5-epimerase
MRFVDVNVIGAKLIEPSAYSDNRGRFMRVWCTREFVKHGADFSPVQANIGFSVRKGTVRGMHFEVAPRWKRS